MRFHLYYQFAERILIKKLGTLMNSNPLVHLNMYIDSRGAYRLLQGSMSIV